MLPLDVIAIKIKIVTVAVAVQHKKKEQWNMRSCSVLWKTQSDMEAV